MSASMNDNKFKDIAGFGSASHQLIPNSSNLISQSSQKVLYPNNSSSKHFFNQIIIDEASGDEADSMCNVTEDEEEAMKKLIKQQQSEAEELRETHLSVIGKVCRVEDTICHVVKLIESIRN